MYIRNNNNNNNNVIKHKKLQVQAVATLTSVATASGQSFVKHLSNVLKLLSQLLQLTDENLLDLRAAATQCLGAVAAAVGREQYGPHLEKYHQLVMSGVQLNSPSLRESTFIYFSELAGLMKSDLLELDSFEDMFALCLTTITDDDGLMVKFPDDGFGETAPRGFLAAQDKIDKEIAEEDAQEEMKLKELDDDELRQLIAEAGDDEEFEDDDYDDDEQEDNELISQTVGIHLGHFLLFVVVLFHVLLIIITNILI
ncbi:importin beta-4 subunit [Reticulomyxa filosa]|uniref:Importin beta-4 subunit n=1 Tax=Reticulomyxa filosa TaxID=46433 RepID=X6MHI1_RETFI|nr:importin beta-4 subunit [Reticulomyxa filosa]|eukprot:ETO13334.1 importin beta-4 subunit [Reticulomyxa filosa]